MHQSKDINELRLYLAQKREECQRVFSLTQSEVDTLLACVDFTRIAAQDGSERASKAIIVRGVTEREGT